MICYGLWSLTMQTDDLRWFVVTLNANWSAVHINTGRSVPNQKAQPAAPFLFACNSFHQGNSSSTPVTSDLSKMFHQICIWLHQLVKTKKSTEDSVIYSLGNPQRVVGDWLTLINKLDTTATYSIPTATCQQQQTTPNHVCPCVCACKPEVPPYRTINK